MRPIDGDNLVEQINRLQEDVYCYQTPSEVADVLDYVSQLLEEQPTIEPYGTWIPCSERLPGKYEICFITQRISNQLLRKVVLHINGEWKFNGRTLKHDSVIAWMPLPEPYKEKNDD